MEKDAVHELTAAYALDALDETEAAEYEAHLGHCDACRQELAALQATAASLAYALEGPAPAPTLRERILVQARNERPNVLPLAPRRALRVATAAAAVAACAALGLGIWAATLSSQLGDERQADARAEEALAVLADPDATRTSLEGAEGTLVVTPSGEAALVVRDLARLPEGQYYTAWVAEGEGVEHAGAFEARGDPSVTVLTKPVPAGGVVAVTIEDRPDATEPSSDPVFTSAQA